jgi:hypothetical protein
MKKIETKPATAKLDAKSIGFGAKGLIYNKT